MTVPHIHNKCLEGRVWVLTDINISGGQLHLHLPTCARWLLWSRRSRCDLCLIKISAYCVTSWPPALLSHHDLDWFVSILLCLFIRHLTKVMLCPLSSVLSIIVNKPLYCRTHIVWKVNGKINFSPMYCIFKYFTKAGGSCGNV